MKGTSVKDAHLDSLSRLLPPESYASLAIQLGLDYSMYARIQAKNTDIRNAFLELLQNWKISTGGQQQDLEKALDKIECAALIEKYKD